MRYRISSQEQGDRTYKLNKEEVKLKSNTVAVLKHWSIRYSTVLYDAKYLKKLAIDIFGEQCLKLSSVFGTPARNTNTKHEALDAPKLNFMRGDFGMSSTTIL